MIRKTTQLHKKVILFSHFQVSGLKYMIFSSFINIDHLEVSVGWIKYLDEYIMLYLQ